MNGNNRWNFKKEISANNTHEVKCKETVRKSLNISVKAMGTKGSIDIYSANDLRNSKSVFFMTMHEMFTVVFGIFVGIMIA
jgi:hypothetical protein